MLMRHPRVERVVQEKIGQYLGNHHTLRAAPITRPHILFGTTSPCATNAARRAGFTFSIDIGVVSISVAAQLFSALKD